MTRLAALLLAALALPAAAQSSITFDICSARQLRVERSPTDPGRLNVYCVGDAQPRLTISDCRAPAQVTTSANGDKRISCPGGWSTVVVRR